jgi:hypothetical protein
MPLWWRSRRGRRTQAAVILNFFLPGLGYMYLGRRRRFDKVILTGFAIGYFVYFASLALPSEETLSFLGVIGTLVIAYAFADDARLLADEQEKGKQTSPAATETRATGTVARLSPITANPRAAADVMG